MNEKTVYIALGSNLGVRERHLERALDAMEKSEIAISKRSSVYETAPQGELVHQPWFLNMVVEAQTELMPMQLLGRLLTVERQVGRVRHAGEQRGGPRPIDLDLLLFGDASVQMPELTVPHPRMLERRFVLEPLLEIAPELRHPVTREPLSKYLTATMNQLVGIKR